MNMSDAVLAKLDELIAAVRSQEDRCIDVEEVARLMDLSTSHVRQRIVTIPSFPTSVTGGGHGRWLRSEVLKWLKARSR